MRTCVAIVAAFIMFSTVYAFGEDESAQNCGADTSKKGIPASKLNEAIKKAAAPRSPSSITAFSGCITIGVKIGGSLLPKPESENAAIETIKAQGQAIEQCPTTITREINERVQAVYTLEEIYIPAKQDIGGAIHCGYVTTHHSIKDKRLHCYPN